MIINFKRKKIKLRPRIKLNHNIYIISLKAFVVSFNCCLSMAGLIRLVDYVIVRDYCSTYFWPLYSVSVDNAIHILEFHFFTSPAQSLRSFHSCRNKVLITPTRVQASRCAGWWQAVMSTQILARRLKVPKLWETSLSINGN